MNNFWLLFLHLTGASIWVGGHLYLALRIVPMAIYRQNSQMLLDFEASFEKLGMSALIIQVLTGVKMADNLLPNWGLLLQHGAQNPLRQLSILLTLKLCWLLLTVLTAISAQLIAIPRIRRDPNSAKARYFFVGHILAVTGLSVVFLATGVLFRTGW
ncbi:hypothetical protein MOMA_00390 [Moraxella macacae 0408225]|uniref:Copper resistance protein D domain-containing protein n=1 Tax=Moraxella macacae 0408225 TaxID=1230338 RepID=L2F6W9_9GAMM|nr:hypothetical protein [Moraxella macacae]ELA08824.1 hypothetical protein MOMA_00390 [Moraxella macacae 0408225]